MRTNRASRLVAAPATALLLGGLAACGSPQTGVLTGTAWPCAGPSYIHTAHLWLLKDSTVVKQLTVPGGSTYRFVLRPGRYRIANTGDLGGPTNAVVVGGQTTHVNVPDLCK